MKKTLLILLTLLSSYVAQAQITYVNAAASGANNGTSWANAYTNLQTALTNTSSGSIWVVAGTYYPGTSGNNAATFTLKNNVQILGGFNGTEGGPTQRDPATNVTILSGDLDQSGTLTANDAYHVVSSGNAGATATIDGFTITGGNAIGGGDDDHGGGIYCRPTSMSIVGNPKIINCIVKQNNANVYGAGIAIICAGLSSSSASPQLLNCKIFDNTSGANGAGVYVSGEGSTSTADPNFENCYIYLNDSPIGGSNFCAEATLNGTVNPILINCTFFRNSAGDDITYYKGATASTLQMHNCILYDQDVVADGQITGNNNDYNLSGSAVWGAGTGNIMSDPFFLNPFAGNLAVNCQSPCIDAGNNSYPTTSYDILGNPRISASSVDIGAFESSYTLPFVTAAATAYNICAGGSTQLYGSGAISYTWTGGVSDGFPFSPTVTDSYTVTGTDANGCVNTNSLTITVNPLPIISIGYSANIVCLGSPVTLYGIGGVNYAWTHAVNDNVPFSPTTTETYTVTGIDANGCQAIDQITVTVENPSALSAGGDYDICSTSTGFLMNGNDGGFANAIWSTTGDGTYDDANLISGSIYTFGSSDLASSTIALVLTATPAVCPVVSDTMIITRHDAPTANILGSGDLCSNVGNVMLTATSVYAGSLIWTSTGTGSFSSPTSTNTFYGPSPAEYAAGLARIAFKATANSPFCPDAEDSIIVQIHSAPNPTVWSSYTICQGDSFLLGFNSPGGTAPFTYQWTNSVPTVISTNNTDYITPTATESYTYTVTDALGCTASFNTTLIYDASEIIYGTAYLGAGVLTSGNVHLIKYYPQPQLFDTLLTTTLDGSGNYAFPPIPHGNYYLSVEPDTLLFPNALITYLGDQTRSELSNTLGHGCLSPTIASLNVQQLLGGTGTGRISGEVVEWNGFGNRYNGPTNQIMVPGGPLKGIDVKLGRNPGGGIQARTSTNDFGKYNFDNLPDGSYSVYVDIPGLPMDSFYVVNVISDSTSNLIYYADSNSVYPTLPIAVGIKDYKTQQLGMGIHPNPATNYTTILFETISVNSTTQIKVFDVTGKMAMSLNLTNLPKGKHEYHLNFANQQLQSGIYFIELMNEKGKQTKKLIVE